MAPERVLTLPLSGLEIRKAVSDLVGKSLEKDGFLNVDTAYDYFECEVSLKLRCHDIGRIAPVNVSEKIVGKAPEFDENSLLDEAEKDFEIRSTSPNETRIETNQEVPVLTRDQDGKEVVKGVRYSRRDLAKAK